MNEWRNVVLEKCVGMYMLIDHENGLARDFLSEEDAVVWLACHVCETLEERLFKALFNYEQGGRLH